MERNLQQWRIIISRKSNVPQAVSYTHLDVYKRHTYPRIPGHENAGIVAKAGKNVTNVKEGDHVIVDLIHTCGECYQCRIGRKNVCEKVMVRGSGMDGGWREYFTAPA